ncbi:MAG: GNAT family N-acetyltransferase [bacterium]
MPDTPSVTRNDPASEFEIRSDAGIAILKYSRHGDMLDLIHTEVPEDLAGRGLGSLLTKSALDYARANNLRVIATCPFVQTYMSRHREYDDLRAEA